jgi:outer membrane receptor protein involved in Fe transport
VGSFNVHASFKVALLAFLSATLTATIFGNVRGLIHDPSHRPVAGAQVTLHALHSDWSQQTTASDSGEFQFAAVPIGDYEIRVSAPGFSDQHLTIPVQSGSAPLLHLALSIAKVQQNVEVHAETPDVNPSSSTTQSTISREQIARTPGADQANSLAMITDYVPGAYIVHDQLHVRGGHQFTWMLDGVPLPNTNIASNVGPQFEPKDVDYLEAQRGGLTAEYGSRAYGVFNVVTRSGFERNREAELVASYGNFNQTDDQLSFGSHSERFAYYASVSANRSDLGLETPTPEVLHDQEAGGSGFVSLIFNKTPSDQLRGLVAIRGDHYQVPNTPEQQDTGVHDVDDERDAFGAFSWLHTFSTNTLLTVSPFFHYNRAHYLGGASDTPVLPEDDRGSSYAGGTVTMAITRGRHNADSGIQAFTQRDNNLFGLHSPAGDIRSRTTLWGQAGSVFADDSYRVRSWLTVNAGLRVSWFDGVLAESAVDPRVGAAVRLPRLHWVLHGFYGHYYQPPPLLSVSSPVLDLAATQGFSFLPLHGERDSQHEVGLEIPLSGWTAAVTQFQTSAHNFFDHDVLGNSNIFFPLTLERALVRGWEATLRSPRLPGGVNLHVAYSRQVVQGSGGVTGGLTSFEPPPAGWYFLDHDQRHTLSAVATAALPWQSQASAAMNYGSGFLDGNGPQHLPSHTTFDLAFGKSFGERVSIRVSALNLTNRRYLLDNSNTFGGTHFVNPRTVSVQLRYRFHY